MAREEFSLKMVIFIPSYIPPHKPQELLVPHEHRVKMLKIALKGNKNFLLSLVEIRRKGISFTVDTLRELKEKYPGIDLFLIMGSDCLNEIHTWKDWKEILALSNLIVFKRWDKEVLPPEGYRGKNGGFYNPDSGKTIEVLSAHPIYISGEEIRKLILEGKSVRYLLPDEVIEYIKKFGLERYWKR